jgi:hypothetical protein
MNLPFKQPRPNKNKPKDIFRKETIEALGISVMSASERSEEDTQLQSTKHRKDNSASAWGKRMEKELAAIEKRAADKTKLGNSEHRNQTEIGQDSDDERPIVETLNKGQPKFGLLSIGTEVMRQFESGLFCRDCEIV